MQSKVRTTLLLLIVISTRLLVAADAAQVRVISWNMESGDSNAEFLADQMAEKQSVDIWGLSEVAADAFETLRSGAETGGNFDIVQGSTGGNDRLAIIYNADRLELLGEDELTEVQLGSANLRAPLVAHFRGRQFQAEFLFMVNHLLRGDGDDDDEARRVRQAQMLNEWAGAQVLPSIVVGDFNADFDCRLGDAGQRAPLFDELVHDGRLQWVRPLSLVRTQKSFNSVLDFVFMVNQQAVPGWSGVSRILDREGDSVAIEPTFDDNDDSTDHRPVDATFSIITTSRDHGMNYFATISPAGISSTLSAQGTIKHAPRPKSLKHDGKDVSQLLIRLDRIEKELAEIRSQLQR